MDNNIEIIPGTIVWIAPFYNRSGFGIGARTSVIALHRAGACIKIIPVDQVEEGIDDCDMTLIKELEKTPVIPPVTIIISHVPNKLWLNVKSPEPNIRILSTTVFDCCAEGGEAPVDMLDVCRQMDQIWLQNPIEENLFISAGFQPEMVHTVIGPHQWLENPSLPPAFPEVTAADRPFRFLNISLFLPRRRWDTLIEAYLEEFKGNENVELYLKVNYPFWHPVPGKPRQDLHDLINSLRQKTGSEARIIIDEDLGARSGIVRLIDSCNVYVTTDTAYTAPISEARVRQRMLIMPEGLLDIPKEEEWYIGIPIDPNAKTPLTREMLLYQPNHRGSSMPLLHVHDVRQALRRAYDMPLSERQTRAEVSSHILGPKETLPPMLSAIRAAWKYKETKERERKMSPSAPLRIVWEGSQFVNHSLALVNRELCLRLIEAGSEVSIIPYERDQFTPEDEPHFKPIAERTKRPLSGPADVHVRHQWPPDFTPPPEGHWVIIQPWEFGSIPREWVRHMAKSVDEVWCPSHYVRDCYIKSGVPAERVFVVPNGVNTSLFNPDTHPYRLKTKKAFKFLFVGGTIQRKGIDILLDVYTHTFSASDDVCLVIKDMGGQSFYKGQTAKDIICKFRADPGNPEIEYIEHTLNDREIAGLYAACDCLVHPYRGEGFGLPIAEAMASGRPVIVTGQGAALDFCNDQIAYLIPARTMLLTEKRIGDMETVDFPWLAEPDKEALARLMKHVVTNREEAAAKGIQAAVFIQANFTWDQAAEVVMTRVGQLQNKPIVRQSWAAAPTSSSTTINKGRISIVIVTCNELKYTRECIESVRKHTPEPHEVIFVDNASTDGTVKWLRRIAQENNNCKILENTKNLGFTKGCNQGIEASSGEYILLLNNDVVVTENWLSGMLECLNSAPDTGIVGPMTNNISGPQKVSDADYKTMDRMHDYAKSFRERYRYRRILFRRVAGFCMLFRRQLVDKIGLLDESFGKDNFEDDDYCLRATLAGCRNLIAGDVFIHHLENRSFIGNRIDYASSMAINKKIFDEKWTGIDINTDLGKKVTAVNIIGKADMLHQKGELNKAIDMLIDGIKCAPEEKELYYQLADMLLDEKRNKDALGAVNSMPPGAKDDVKRLEIIAYCTEDIEEAGKYADRILERDKTYAPALNLKGIVAHKQGNNAAADGFFEQAIASDPGYGEPYTNRGLLKWVLDRKEEALNLLEKGFILSPTLMDNADLYHSAITALGQFERAEKMFRDAKELYPGNKRIQFSLIDILIKQEKFDKAMDEIERAMLNFDIDDGMLSAALEVRDRVGTKEIDKTATNKGTLSLCMIVKNEEQNIARCLMSAKPVVDEMIIVDTGSTDRTKDIARAYGAKVFDFPWTNDFSAARNYSLSMSAGAWVLVLDADEVISPLDYAAFERIVKKRPSVPVAYIMVTRNYTNEIILKGWTANDRKYLREEAGTGWFPSEKVRLFVNDKRIRFQNPVHEFVEASLKKAGIDIKTSGIPVHHYGRFDRDKLVAKGREYFLLGKKKIGEMKGDLKALKELAIQASELGEYDTAVELWEKVIELNQKDSVAFLNIGYAYHKLGKYQEALIASRRAMALDPAVKEAALNYAGNEFIIGDIGETISVLEALLRKVPDYPPAILMVAAAYYVNGQKEAGLELFEKLRKRGFNWTDFIDEQARALISQGRFDQAVLLLEVAVKTGSVSKDTHRLLAELQSRKG
jgi:GT2 family glycosyltransferase/glycosyltransferase involved in cell wall biosynthesis/tetratricopeptide (TPR) repeat protein